MKMKPLKEQEEVHNKQWTQKLQMFFHFFFSLVGKQWTLCALFPFTITGARDLFPLVYEKLYSWAMMSAHLQNVSKVTAPRQWHFIPLFLIFFFYSKWANWKWEHTSLEQTRLAGLLALPSEPLHSHSSQPARPLGSNWASPLDAALLDTCWEHSMQWAIGMRIQKVWKPWMLLLLLGNLQCSPARCVLWNCPDVACLTKACTTPGKQSARPANWCKHIYRTGLPSASWGQNVPRCLFLYQLLLTVHLNWRNIILFFFFFPPLN